MRSDDRFSFSSEAKEELIESYGWYENRRSGLGEEFFLRVEECLEAVYRNPLRYPVSRAPYSRALMSRFPFAIHFKSSANGIEILAVFHTSRDPGVLEIRADESRE